MTQELCDPIIETCTSAVDMHRYEEYEEYNRFLGLVAGVAGIAPTFLFFYPMYLGKTSEERALLKASHKYFMASWGIFALTHLFLFVPFTVAWAMQGAGFD